MPNEQEIRRMVEGILAQMASGEAPAPVKGEIALPPQIPHKKNNFSEAGELEDITAINLKKQFLVPNPKDKDGYLKMKEYTPARIGIWRAGMRYKTETMLRFRADHAAAQDAVFSYVSDDYLNSMDLIRIETLCKDKDEYLTRPDLGRGISPETAAFLKQQIPSPPRVQIVLGDGLSSSAIEANAKDIIPSVKQGLSGLGIETGKVIFVKHCRVGVMDAISEAVGAEVTLLLVGERPGLITAESMSAYIAYKATVGMGDARRTVVSNIHNGGTPAVEAGAHISHIVDRMLKEKASGVDLKL